MAPERLERDPAVGRALISDATGHPVSPFRPLSAHRPAVEAGAGATPPDPAGSALPPLRWQVSYERASVERFVAEVEAERSRLRSQIEESKAEVERAKAAAARQAAAQAELAAMVLAIQVETARIEREHRDTLEAIGAAAEEAAVRLLAAGREEAAAMRAAAAFVAETPARPTGVRNDDR